MLGRQHWQPVNRRVCAIPVTAVGASGFTFTFPTGPQSGTAAAWFDRPGQFGRVLYMTAGLTFASTVGARHFRYSFIDGATLLTTFVARGGNMTPPSIGFYLEQSYAIGTGSTNLSGASLGFMVWPPDGVFIKQGDSINIADIAAANVADTVAVTATVEFFN